MKRGIDGEKIYFSLRDDVTNERGRLFIGLQRQFHLVILKGE